jgi:hypothetical protein
MIDLISITKSQPCIQPELPLGKQVRSMGLREFSYLYEDSDAPDVFQRKECWSPKDRKEFFQSICKNIVDGGAVMVDCISCKEMIRNFYAYTQSEIAKDSTYTLLEELGSEYITLDANNRLQFLKSLFNNEYVIPKGEYKIITGGEMKTFTVDEFGFHFRDLPKEYRRELERRIITVTEYSSISRKRMSDVFIAVNSGVSVKPQEKRNAMDSLWASRIRDLCKESKVYGFLKLIMKDPDKGYAGQEYIAKCIDIQRLKDGKPINVNDVTLDYMYDETLCLDTKWKFYTGRLNTLITYVNTSLNDNSLTVHKSSLKRGSMIMNLYFLMCQGVINTYDQYRDALEEHEEIYIDVDFTIGEHDFKWACGGSGKNHTAIRLKAFEQIQSVIERTTY